MSRPALGRCDLAASTLVTPLGCAAQAQVPQCNLAGGTWQHESRRRWPSRVSSKDEGHAGLLGGDLPTVFPLSDSLLLKLLLKDFNVYWKKPN